MTDRSLTALAGILAVLLAALVFSGCASLTQLAADTGLVSESQADALGAAGETIGKAFEGLTPEQEYYLGRSVAATILSQYPALDDDRANAYLNDLGQSLALASDKPYTFKGYRFLLLDSDEINAFATPGGFILITRGMLACTGSEDTLAAVLAHEIGHVQLDHGVKAIKASRWTDAITKTAVAGVAMSDAEVAEVTGAFGDSIGDITQTLVVGGYSRRQEKQADEAAAVILSRVGYDPEAIVRMLEEMDRRWDPEAKDFAATHPSPQDRIAEVRGTVESLDAPVAGGEALRDARFRRAFAAVL